MTPARFQTIEQTYREALAQQPDQISVFLDNACKGDAALRHKVEALLSSRQRAGGFIESSAVSLAAKLIQNGQADSLVGETIGHYKICESIGAGGMGEVYLATDTVAARKAALKLLPLRFTGDADFVNGDHVWVRPSANYQQNAAQRSSTTVSQRARVTAGAERPSSETGS